MFLFVTVGACLTTSNKSERQPATCMRYRIWFIMYYPLVMTNSLLLNMTIEIVDLPINSMVIFHSYVNVYQRVSCITQQNCKPMDRDCFTGQYQTLTCCLCFNHQATGCETNGKKKSNTVCLSSRAPRGAWAAPTPYICTQHAD